MPVNDEARSRADTWAAQKWEMIEHECEPHPVDHAPRGPASMRIYSDIRQLDQKVVAWHMQLLWMPPQRTIYMDSRPHPSEYAAHTWQGFSTGEWVADMLKVTTTHMKEGWLRRDTTMTGNIKGAAGCMPTTVRMRYGTRRAAKARRAIW